MSVNKYILPPNSTRKSPKIQWEVQARYTNYKGEVISKHKRGFDTMKEAKAWEASFQSRMGCKLGEMTFYDFVLKYYENLDLRENTFRSKKYIIDLKILPYFGKRKMIEINQADIFEWQKEIKRNNYSDTYLKTINAQLSAIFNHAVQIYDLPCNPCKKIKSMGKSKAKEMQIWTQEQFELFLEKISDKPVSHYAFLLFFWCGLRMGELLALTKGDFDFENNTLRINKSCQYIEGRRVITPPKTEKSNRVIGLPQMLATELNKYLAQLYGYQDSDIIFPRTKYYFEHEMRRGSLLAGLPKIRVHDLRHSHASMLISKLNMPIVDVSRRLGHENVSVTLDTYSHLYPQHRELISHELNEQMLKEE